MKKVEESGPAHSPQKEDIKKKTKEYLTSQDVLKISTIIVKYFI